MITPIKHHRLHRLNEDYTDLDVICVINLRNLCNLYFKMSPKRKRNPFIVK